MAEQGEKIRLEKGEIKLLEKLIMQARRDLLRPARTPIEKRNLLESLDFFFNDTNPTFRLICFIAKADIRRARKAIFEEIRRNHVEIPGLFALSFFSDFELCPGESRKEPGPLFEQRTGEARS